MAKKHNLEEVLSNLKRKPSVVGIDTTNRIIEVNMGGTDLGSGSWGKIDFLTKFNNYTLIKYHQ